MHARMHAGALVGCMSSMRPMDQNGCFTDAGSAHSRCNNSSWNGDHIYTIGQ